MSESNRAQHADSAPSPGGTPADSQSAGEDTRKAKRAAAARKAAETRKGNRSKALGSTSGAATTLGLMSMLLAGIRENVRPVPQPIKGLLSASVVAILAMSLASMFIPWQSFGAYSGNFVVFATLLVLLGGLVLIPPGWPRLDEIRLRSINLLSIIFIITIGGFSVVSILHYYKKAVSSQLAGSPSFSGPITTGPATASQPGSPPSKPLDTTNPDASGRSLRVGG